MAFNARIQRTMAFNARLQRKAATPPLATSPINAGSNAHFLSLQVPLCPRPCLFRMCRTGCRRPLWPEVSPGKSGTALIYSAACCSHACPTSTRRECQLQLRAWSAFFLFSLPALSVTHRSKLRNAHPRMANARISMENARIRCTSTQSSSQLRDAHPRMDNSRISTD